MPLCSIKKDKGIFDEVLTYYTLNCYLSKNLRKFWYATCFVVKMSINDARYVLRWPTISNTWVALINEIFNTITISIYTMCNEDKIALSI